jgi:hypothetical protein
MTSVSCAVCGEPWDTYHLRPDAPPWVMPLFRAGAGCESCEGGAPKVAEVDGTGPLVQRHLIARVVGAAFDDDPDPVGDVLLDPRPKWQRPNDTVMWECECCGIKRMHDVDFHHDDFDYFELTPQQRQMYRFDEPDDEPEEYEGKTYCSNCLVWCDECGERMLTEDAVLDQENDPYGRKPLHEDCYLTRRAERHHLWIVDEISRVTYKNDADFVGEDGLDIDVEDVAFRIMDGLNWGDGGRQPDDTTIWNWLVEGGYVTAEEDEDE